MPSYMILILSVVCYKWLPKFTHCKNGHCCWLRCCTCTSITQVSVDSVSDISSSLLQSDWSLWESSFSSCHFLKKWYVKMPMNTTNTTPNHDGIQSVLLFNSWESICRQGLQEQCCSWKMLRLRRKKYSSRLSHGG